MWIYNEKTIGDKDIPSDAIGFLYRITHLSTGKWYIGRKLLSKSVTRQSKGKKIKSKIESDWKEYWSSSDVIKALVEEKGEADFKREILIFVTTKAQLLYAEEYALYVTGSLFDNLCLNQNIRSRIFKKWFGKSPDFHQKIAMILNT